MTTVTKFGVKYPAIISAILLFLCGVALFSNTFGNAWTLDDFPVIVNNPDIRSIKLFLENSYPGRPLREITFLLDYSLFGLNPSWYHLQQIFWHALNAWLIFNLVCRLQGGKATAWVASILFLVHPLHVEVVANISHRKDSLVLAFSLLALLAYTSALNDDGRRWKWISAAVVLAVTASFAKQTAAVLPVAFMAYELAFVPKEQRVLLKYPRIFLPILIAGGIAIIGWFSITGKEDYLAAMSGVMAKMNLSFSPESPGRYFLVMFKSMAFMFSKWIWPFNLSPEYTFSPPTSWIDFWVLGGVLGVIAYIALLLWTRRRSSLAFFALSWMGLFWIPVSNIVPISYFAADRYLYAPSVGFLICIAILIQRAADRFRVVAIIGTVSLTVALVCLTWTQNRVWASNITLWEHAVKVSPESTAALNNVGAAYMEKGDWDKALVYFGRAARNFTDPMPYYNMGWIYEQKGQVEKAINNYRYFLAFQDPRHLKLANAMKIRVYKKYGIALK